MSTKETTTPAPATAKPAAAAKPSVAPALPRGTAPLSKVYKHPNGAEVCYHDAAGNAYNAQQRYVGKAVSDK